MSAPGSRHVTMPPRLPVAAFGRLMQDVAATAAAIGTGGNTWVAGTWIFTSAEGARAIRTSRDGRISTSRGAA